MPVFFFFEKVWKTIAWAACEDEVPVLNALRSFIDWSDRMVEEQECVGHEMGLFEHYLL